MGKNKPERGTYVSRSVYQKVVEENNRLKRDLFIISMTDNDASIIASMEMQLKWRKKFEKDIELRQMLHDYAIQYVKDNPDSVVAQISRKFPPKECKPK